MQSKSRVALSVFVVVTAMVLLVVATILEINAIPVSNAGWDEVGQGSASGGGISDNTGESGWPNVVIGDGNRPYITWYDATSGDKEIYVRRWNGSAWAEVGYQSASGGGISKNSSISTAPSIVAGPGGKPCIAWRDFSSGYFEVYLRCWNGTSWGELGANSATGGGVSSQQGSSSWGPSLTAAFDGTLYVAWDNDGQFSNEIYVARWNGSSWQKLPMSGSVSSNSSNSWLPSIAVAPDGTPYVAWQDDSGSDSEIYIRRWNGSAWVEVGSGSATWGGISRNSGNSDRPNLVISAGGTPFVAWQDDSSGNSEIYIRRWNGVDWVEVGPNSATGGGISKNDSSSKRPSIALNDGENPCVTWQDNAPGQNEIYVRCWDGSQWSEIDAGSATGKGISNNNGQSSSPALIVSEDSRAYTTWGDNSSGNYEIYVRSRLLADEPPPTATATASPSATPSPTPVPKILNYMPMVRGLVQGSDYPPTPTFTPSPTMTPTATSTPTSYPYPYP